VRNLSIKLYRIYVRYTLYHVIYSVRYFPRFLVTALERITRECGGPPVIPNSPYPSPVWSQEYAGMYGTEMLEIT